MNRQDAKNAKGQSIDLSLCLDVCEPRNPGRCLSLELLLTNQSAIRLLLPKPEIVGLHFWQSDSSWQNTWLTNSLVSTKGRTTTLDPGGKSKYRFDVRFEDFFEAEGDDLYSDYCRWCTDLKPGSYFVEYQLNICDDYFDPDSHWRISDLERAAEAERATVWRGYSVSNTVEIERRE